MKESSIHLQVRIEKTLHERLLAISVSEARALRVIAARALETEASRVESEQKEAAQKKKTRKA